MYYPHLFVLHSWYNHLALCTLYASSEVKVTCTETYTWLLAHASDVVLTINNRQYKNYKLTRFVAQIDWKISQVEAVQFCCCPDICKNKVNYYNCVSHDNNNQSKKPSSFSILVLIVLGYCYSTDLSMYW